MANFNSTNNKSAAGSLSGSTLASGVTSSSLTSFGNSPTLVTPAFSGNVSTDISLASGKVVNLTPVSNSYFPSNGYVSGNYIRLYGALSGSTYDPTIQFYNSGKSGAGLAYWFVNSGATGNADANSFALIDAGFNIRAQFPDAGGVNLLGSLGLTSNSATLTFSGTGNHDITASSGTLRLGALTLTGTITGNGQSVSGVGSLTSTGAITSSSASAGVGYTTGATVTQATSKTTGVTISAMCGTIVTSNSALNSGEYVVFTVTNTSVGANDFVDVKLKSGAANDGSYSIERVATSSGSFKVKIWNTYGDATSLSEALTLDFIVFKSAIS